MIRLKNKHEIELMQEGGKILNNVFSDIKKHIISGETTINIDKMIDSFIKIKGAESGFKLVPGYQHTSCISINNQVVHTPPSSRKIMPGDIVTIDAGVYFKGYHTDKATTYQIKPENTRMTKFLQTGNNTLTLAISQAVSGNRLSQISKTIENNITNAGYKIIMDLTGHGIGKELHEDPYIPGFYNADSYKDYILEPGMALAIEVIYSESSNYIKSETGSSWSLVTKDGSVAACFENTIIVTENKPLILT